MSRRGGVCPPAQAIPVVRLTAQDVPDVLAIERECFTLPWSESQMRAAFVQSHFVAFGLRCIHFGRMQLCAYVSLYHATDEVEIVNIAVLPAYRRQGHGARLLHHALRQMQKAGMQRAVLEVRTGNTAALALYTRFGFVQTGMRKAYYADTNEDALIMEKYMQKIIAANWKMFKTRAESARTAREIRSALAGREDCGVIIFAPFTAIAQVANALEGAPFIATGGQNVYPAAEGAFTGEVSPLMLRDAGASWVLVGHSERRHTLGESLEFIAKKTAFALAQGLKVMLCIGETLAEREAGQLEAVLAHQLQSAFSAVAQPLDTTNLAVAYEPVWAIGTGRVAGAEEITAAHALTRRLLGQCIGEAVASRIPLLYGGSVKAENAAAIITLDNVDGLLVGGASLQAETFVRIVTAY